MGNSSTLFDRPFQINHIQRSLDTHGFPTTTFLVYHNVIVSVDLNKFPFFFPLLSFSTDRWVFQVEGVEGLIGPYAVVAAFECEKKKRWKHDILSKKKKKEIWKRSMEAIVLFPAIAYFSCLSFLFFFFLLLFTFLFISLTFSDSSYVRTYCSYEDFLAEQREICWYVWTGKFFFSSNRLFLFCFSFFVVVCLFLLSALICLTVLFFFDIFRY